MIHKLGKLKDLFSLPPMSTECRSIVLEKVKVLSTVYGEDRDIDNDDGGFVLYCSCGTKAEEIKEYFDYTKRLPEYVDVSDGICHALYLTTNEYSVSIIIHENDLPDEIRKEIDNNGDC